MASGQKRVPKKTLLVKAKIEQNLWSPRVFFLTHSQMVNFCQRGFEQVRAWADAVFFFLLEETYPTAFE